MWFVLFHRIYKFYHLLRFKNPLYYTKSIYQHVIIVILVHLKVSSNLKPPVGLELTTPSSFVHNSMKDLLSIMIPNSSSSGSLLLQLKAQSYLKGKAKLKNTSRPGHSWNAVRIPETQMWRKDPSKQFKGHLKVKVTETCLKGNTLYNTPEQKKCAILFI